MAGSDISASAAGSLRGSAQERPPGAPGENLPPREQRDRLDTPDGWGDAAPLPALAARVSRPLACGWQRPPTRPRGRLGWAQARSTSSRERSWWTKTSATSPAQRPRTVHRTVLPGAPVEPVRGQPQRQLHRPADHLRHRGVCRLCRPAQPPPIRGQRHKEPGQGVLPASIFGRSIPGEWLRPRPTGSAVARKVP